MVIVDGPPIYLRNFKLTSEIDFIKSLNEPVVDHHSARELGWREALGVKMAYNDILGLEERTLEAKRRELYEEIPVEESWFKMKFREMRELYFPNAK